MVSTYVAPERSTPGSSPLMEISSSPPAAAASSCAVASHTSVPAIVVPLRIRAVSAVVLAPVVNCSQPSRKTVDLRPVDTPGSVQTTVSFVVVTLTFVGSYSVNTLRLIGFNSYSNSAGIGVVGPRGHNSLFGPDGYSMTRAKIRLYWSAPCIDVVALDST